MKLVIKVGRCELHSLTLLSAYKASLRLCKEISLFLDFNSETYKCALLLHSCIGEFLPATVHLILTFSTNRSDKVLYNPYCSLVYTILTNLLSLYSGSPKNDGSNFIRFSGRSMNLNFTGVSLTVISFF